jgi:hypothetical protein
MFLVCYWRGLRASWLDASWRPRSTWLDPRRNETITNMAGVFRLVVKRFSRAVFLNVREPSVTKLKTLAAVVRLRSVLDQRAHRLA